MLNIKYNVSNKLNQPLCLTFCICLLSIYSCAANRSPLPESNPAKTEETPYILFPPTNNGVGEAVPPPEIFGVCRTLSISKVSQNDRRTSENLVPEQTDKMEVCLK